MTRLILTGWPIPEFTKPDFADLAVEFFFRFGWGRLPSPDELAAYLGPRTPDHAPGHHWSDFASRWSQSENRNSRDLSLAEFCQQYETVELWFDTQPNAQLRLVWLLDYFRSHPETVGTAAVGCEVRNDPGGALEETRLSGLPLARFCPPAASQTNRRESPRIDRLSASGARRSSYGPIRSQMHN